MSTFSQCSLWPDKPVLSKHITGECSFGLGHLSNLSVIALYSISRVNEGSNWNRILEIGGQLLPVVLPWGDHYGIFGLSLTSQRFQFHLDQNFGIDSVHTLDIPHELLLILTGYILQGITDMVGNAALNLRFGIDTPNRFGKAPQVIRTGDQDVVQSPVLKIAKDRQPEIGSFTLQQIGSRHLLAHLMVDPQNVVKSFMLKLPLLAHFVVHGIEPYDAVNCPNGRFCQVLIWGMVRSVISKRTVWKISLSNNSLIWQLMSRRLIPSLYKSMILSAILSDRMISRFFW